MSMAIQPKVLRSLKSLKLALYQFNVTFSNWFAKGKLFSRKLFIFAKQRAYNIFAKRYILLSINIIKGRDMSYLDTIEIAEAQEGQQVEFKEASFELPDDLWETYSAFANTEGGEIILGISEDRESHQFSITGVLDPQKLIDSFWNTVRDPQKVSRDVMLRDGVLYY